MPPAPATNAPNPAEMVPVPDSGIPATLAAELDRFDRILGASGSATAMLIQWINSRSARAVTSITARRLRDDIALVPSADSLHRLQVKSPTDIACRRVRLMDGRRVLSEARNFYVPARLNETMRTLLETSDIPFGTIIAPLSPQRETLEVERYWPTAEKAASTGCRLPTRLLRHDALVRAGNGLPLSEVSEVYTRNILR